MGPAFDQQVEIAVFAGLAPSKRAENADSCHTVLGGNGKDCLPLRQPRHVKLGGIGHRHDSHHAGLNRIGHHEVSGVRR